MTDLCFMCGQPPLPETTLFNVAGNRVQATQAVQRNRGLRYAQCVGEWTQYGYCTFTIIETEEAIKELTVWAASQTGTHPTGPGTLLAFSQTPELK